MVDGRLAFSTCKVDASVIDEKTAIRKQFIPRRHGASTGNPAEVAARVSKILPPWHQDLVLASYLPIRGEWDPWPVIRHLGNIKTAIPVTPQDPGPLTFKQWAWGDQTVEAKFKTREPLPSAPSINLNRLVFLVPGVAIDLSGVRMGYGGGYYDRTFAALGGHLDRARIIGFMLDEQVSDNPLPREDTDIALGHLVTPTRVMSF